jgi:hypothetical protein
MGIGECRETKVDLNLIGPPSPQEVIQAAAGNIEKSLATTNIHVAKYFEETAERLLEDGVGHAKSPTEVLSMVMALMSGYTELPKERSILGQQEGYVTLGMSTPRGAGFPTPGALIGSIRRVTNEKVASRIGRVELFDDPEDAGFEAAFDLPKNDVDAVIEAAAAHGAPRFFYLRYCTYHLGRRVQDTTFEIVIKSVLIFNEVGTEDHLGAVFV